MVWGQQNYPEISHLNSMKIKLNSTANNLLYKKFIINNIHVRKYERKITQYFI